MDTENELDIYLEKIRRCFPKGFSKYFYKNKSGKDFSLMDEDTLNDILSNFRSDIIATQKRGNFDFSYRSLVKEFGKPRKVMRELLQETLPEEEFAKLKQKRNRICIAVGACIAITVLSLSVFGTCVYTSRIDPVQEIRTLVIKNSDDMPSVNGTRDVIKLFEGKGDNIE